jgi:two-component system chemotaxis response regulator CheB
VAAQILVIGASAGGLPALQQILRGLPSEFPVIVCAVVHIPAWRESLLPSVLTTNGRRAIEPVNHEELVAGTVYIAPPDHHLMVERGQAIVWHGPKENSHRPAVNALFRSAAVAYREGVVGIVLSGALEDGATGLWWIKRHGGVAIVQDPKDALFPSMPESALSAVDVDYCVPVRDVAPLLMQLVQDSPPRPPFKGGEAHA